ncbi:V-set and transmembrane domain-containing protein 4 isoform X1 [Petaurus breviceps papuanus]|uniref:V-set and transmembrane domain-containing protein 4 isoform X1 n=1 Tax=Petaurus breviceps papuanus TaxID=3040969 RepID=UPI0036DD7399
MRLLALALAFLAARAPVPDICEALNVTVSPGPIVQYLEGENATLFCHVSQKRRKDNFLAIRWLFALSPSQEKLMIKMTRLRMVQYYGNYSRSSNRQRLRLQEERYGRLYSLSILNLQPADQGKYICKVHEVGKHRSKWTTWSNGTAATEIRVISPKASDDSTFEKKKETWAFFEDLYMYAVLVCCIGILSVLLFTLIILCQSLLNKRKSRVKHYLVKCPQNSSGETVTSVTSLSPLQPKKIKKRKEKPDVPPAVPAKAPIANAFHKPKLLKPQRKVILEDAFGRTFTFIYTTIYGHGPEKKRKPAKLVRAERTFTVVKKMGRGMIAVLHDICHTA